MLERGVRSAPNVTNVTKGLTSLCWRYDTVKESDDDYIRTVLCRMVTMSMGVMTKLKTGKMIETLISNAMKMKTSLKNLETSYTLNTR